MSIALDFRQVDILFPRQPGAGSAASLTAAQALLEGGASRADILAATGVVVGVAGANLTVRQGEISVLMGLSGSGKSTLLRAANGLNAVTRGAVLVADGDRSVDIACCDPATLRAVRRHRIAMVFQQFGLLPWRSVRDNVGLGLELRGESAQARRRRVDEKLELVGLSQWADHAVGELSGGMQQRVGLARAFATDADILLMDEPFSALDPLIRTKLQDELVELQESLHKTIVFVTHDLDEALRIGDQISVLEGGRIIQTGTPQDIVLRPATAYVAEFVQHMNPLTVLRAGMVMREVPSLRRDGDWLRFGPALAYGIRDGHRPLDVAHTPEGPAQLPQASPQTTLRELVGLLAQSRQPVLICEGATVLGVCTADEVVGALSGTRGAPKQAGDAN